MRSKILLVDDESAVLELLSEALASEPYELALATRAAEAFDLVESFQPDLIICDVNLPDQSGLDICRRVKYQHPEQAFVFLSGLDEEIDQVLGLESGADDYLVKPFRIKELRARIRAVLRRSGLQALHSWVPTSAGQASQAAQRLLQAHDLQLNLQAAQVSLAGQPLALTRKEFELLCWLMQHPGQLMTRAQLLDQLWPTDYGLDERSIDALVRRLRKKLNDAAEQPRFIETVRGMGYRFRDPARR